MQVVAGSSTAALPLSRIAWAGALLAVLLLRLGAAPLADVDEGAFAEATRELLASGDWGHTTLNGADRFDKPIAIYWLQAASVALFGLNEAALRLPSALAGWAWALALWAFAAPRLGRDAGRAAAALLVASLGALVIARAATADALLNLLLTLAALDLWRLAEQPAEPRPLRRAWACMGLGLLVKGPIALLVPLAAFSLWAVSAGRFALLRQAWLDRRAWALLLLIAAPWYAYALQRHGWAFVDGFLLRHNLQRFGGTLEGHGGSLAYYLLALPLLLLPGTPLLAAVLRHGRAHWAQPLTRYLLFWAGFVLLFFSVSGTKLPHYGLYGASPLLLLMAIELCRAGRRLRLALVGAQALLLALVLVPAWWTAELATAVRDPLYRELLAQARAPDAALQAVAIAALLLSAAGLRWAWAAPARAEAGPAAALLAAGLIGGVALPWWIALAQAPVRELALQARAQGATLVQWRLHQPSVAVYREQPVPRREPQPGEWALARRDRIADAPWPLRVRAQAGPYLLVERLEAAK